MTISTLLEQRLRDFDVPPYCAIARQEGWTLPDLDESAEFRDVRIYLADQGSK